jgi:hypothetical protein
MIGLWIGRKRYQLFQRLDGDNDRDIPVTDQVAPNTYKHNT